jgi:hypothetical protein
LGKEFCPFPGAGLFFFFFREKKGREREKRHHREKQKNIIYNQLQCDQELLPPAVPSPEKSLAIQFAHSIQFPAILKVCTVYSRHRGVLIRSIVFTGEKAFSRQPQPERRHSWEKGNREQGTGGRLENLQPLTRRDP